MRVTAAAKRFEVPSHHIHYLRKTGLLSSARSALDFQDLRRLQFIAECRRQNLSLQRIRKFLGHAASAGRSPEGPRPNLLGQQLLLVEGQQTLLEPQSGQLFFQFEPASPAGAVVDLDARARSLRKNEILESLEAQFQDALERAHEPDIRALLEEILALEPDHSGALIELGNLAFERGEFQTAEHYYDRVVQADPNSVEGIYNLANVYFRTKKYAAAIRSYQTTLALDPEFPESYYNLALVYFSLRHLDKAAHFFRCYLELDPESGWRSQAEDFLNEIESALDAGNPQLFG